MNRLGQAERRWAIHGRSSFVAGSLCFKVWAAKNRKPFWTVCASSYDSNSLQPLVGGGLMYVPKYREESGRGQEPGETCKVTHHEKSGSFCCLHAFGVLFRSLGGRRKWCWDAGGAALTQTC